MTIVSALATVVMIAADLDQTSRFYAAALDATPVSRAPLVDAGWLRLLGLDGRRAERLVMRIGRDEVVFVAVDPPGASYPLDGTATDLWFQHIAVVVTDMDRVFAQVQATGAAPISRQGPERLPAGAGGVRAYKFRDPDGHPLELLQFPAGSGPDRWRAGAPGQAVLGIDHSAIAVGDADWSAAFYVATLGMARTGATVNRGPAQVGLDDVPDDAVDVVALSPIQPTPHVELLGYRVGRRRPMPSGSGPADIAATRLVLIADEVATLASQALPAMLDDGGRGVALRDPDGHRLVVLERRSPS